jgi:hypothetical protein
VDRFVLNIGWEKAVMTVLILRNVIRRFRLRFMKKSFEFEYEKWIAGTAFLSRKEKGAYMDLLCMQAEKGHMTLQEIKDILNGDFDTWDKIKSKFNEVDGKFYNKKLESVINGKHKKTEVEIAIDKTKIEQLICEKKLKFYNDCKPFLEKYPKDMLRRFYDYWTEMNKAGTKLRFEREPIFEICKRLVTWARLDKEYNKIEKTPENITYKELVDRHNKGEVDMANWEQVTPGEIKSKWKPKKQ